LTVGLPKEFVAQIDDVPEALPTVGNRERFVAFAVLLALRDIQQGEAVGLDRF
jgi:hypothetical protein